MSQGKIAKAKSKYSCSLQEVQLKKKNMNTITATSTSPTQYPIQQYDQLDKRSSLPKEQYLSSFTDAKSLVSIKQRILQVYNNQKCT